VKASSDAVLEIQTFITPENSKALQPNSTILMSVNLQFILQLSTLISAEILEKESTKSHSHGTCYTMTFFFSLMLPVLYWFFISLKSRSAIFAMQNMQQKIVVSLLWLFVVGFFFCLVGFFPVGIFL